MENKAIDLDLTDYKILCLLQEDARMPSKQIADQLQLDIRTVNKRITSMLSLGVMRTSVVFDGANFGYNCIEEIYIKINAENYDETAEKLKSNSKISYMAVHWGDNTIELQGRFKSHQEMHHFLHTELPSYAGVEVISSTLAPDIRKDIDSWFPSESMFKKEK